MISTRGQLARTAAIRRFSHFTICRPSGRQAGRSTAAIMRPSPSNTTIGWKPYSSLGSSPRAGSVRVEQAKLLAAMHGIEGVIDIEHDASRHPPEAVAVMIDHGTAHAQQGARIGQVLGARDRGLRAQISVVRQA